MTLTTPNLLIKRRGLLKTGAATAGLSSLAMPAVTWAASDNPIKIGVDDPRTGPYAALGENQVRGVTMAVDAINKKGGVLGRPLQMVVEDSQGLPGPAISKAQKMVSEDKVSFLVGSVSSAVSSALSQFAGQHDLVYIDTGGHADSVTGKDCRWNTFRTCSTSWMLSAGDFKPLFDKFGKKWFFIVPDYNYGHSVYNSYVELLKKAGGTVVGEALAPLGTTDFSSYLIQARAAKPDVLMCLQAGDDLVNLLKQSSQFGMASQMAVGGALMELEVLEALPPTALLGWWTMEWYWDQPGVPHLAEFVADYKARFGKVPTARSWFGYASAHALAMAANNAKSLDAMKVVKALEGMELPPEVALQPGKCYYRAEDHQMIANVFPGYVPKGATYPNLFHVAETTPGGTIAKTPQESGCKLVYPS